MSRDDGTESAISSSRSSRRSKSESPKSKLPRHKSKNKNKEDSGIKNKMKEMINLINNSRTQEKLSSNQNNNHKIKTFEFEDCYKLYAKHLTHMMFLKDNNFLKSPRKDEVLENIVKVY